MTICSLWLKCPFLDLPDRGERAMRRVFAFLLVCFGIFAPVPADAQRAVITIDHFLQWQWIDGRVSGLKQPQLQPYFVVVYAHAQNGTWYIEPYQYVGPEPGLSWTKPDTGGNWSFSLVPHRGTELVDCIAALLVDHPVMRQDFEIPYLGKIHPQLVASIESGLADGKLVTGGCAGHH